MEDQIPPRGPKCERLGQGRRNVRAHVMHRRGPTRARPIRATTAHGGEDPHASINMQKHPWTAL